MILDENGLRCNLLMIYNTLCTSKNLKGGYIPMDFNANRGSRPQTSNSPASAPRPAGPSGGGTENTSGPSKPAGDSGIKNKVLNLKFASVSLLFSATILVVALLAFLVVGAPQNESNFVENDKYQAVFLNGGQVYFGQVTDLNSEYLRLVDIYYLRVNQQVQPAEGEQPQVPSDGDISLVKLGCELHGPKDEMLINRDQIIFWENLKEEGQVSEAIATFKAENPDGQDCEAPEGGAAIPDQGGQAPEQQVPGIPTEESDEE